MAKRSNEVQVPRHVACVMDGNGRWAEQRGLTRSDGHAALEGAMLETTFAAADIGIDWLTLYAFSTENWNRPIEEVAFLMELNESILVRRIDELHDRDVRVRFMGRFDGRMPHSLREQMDSAVAMTADNKGLTLTIAFNYGGRAEIVDAMQRMLAEGIPSESVDEEQLRRFLYAPDMPDPDVVIRTSGEYRLSNFLLWELAYSELVFTDVLWPDFGRQQLREAINDFRTRDRRFGKVVPLRKRNLVSAASSAR